MVGEVEGDKSIGSSATQSPAKSKSKEVQSGQLAHAICNMTETLASYKVLHIMKDITNIFLTSGLPQADVQLVDREQAEHMDAALETILSPPNHSLSYYRFCDSAFLSFLVYFS